MEQASFKVLPAWPISELLEGQRVSRVSLPSLAAEKAPVLYRTNKTP
jgi:hypothetical protein